MRMENDVRKTKWINHQKKIKNLKLYLVKNDTWHNEIFISQIKGIFWNCGSLRFHSCGIWCHIISSNLLSDLLPPQREGEPHQQTLSEVCGPRSRDPLLCGERETEWRCVQLLLCGPALYNCHGGTYRPLVSSYHFFCVCVFFPHPHLDTLKYNLDGHGWVN